MKKTSVSPSPKETPYSAAIAQHQEAQLNVAFTRRLLSCNGWLGIALTGAIVINGYLAWKVANPPLAVVASDNGRIIPLPAMNKATYS
ncbi:TPA: conjugal transfer protein TraM, partial [Escherichia coli]|nr:conjugal transfer protein TraM [Escherichia coli]